MSAELKGNIILSIDEIVHLFRIGENNSGNKKLKILVDQLAQYTTISISDVEITEINKIFMSLINAMTSKDYVFMCDILKYELKGFLCSKEN